VEVLNSGRTFGEVLNGASLTGNDQQTLLLAFREHADPRRLRAGTEVTLRYLRGDGQVRGIDVAVSRDEVVRLEWDPYGWRSSVVQTPILLDTLGVQGTIESELWTAVVMNPDLGHVPLADRAQVMHLMTQVFQWQIDFYRQIQPGDGYRLVIEREVRPDGTMRSGRILAAQVVNVGKPVSAIWFDLRDDGVGGYYDLAGESLRRAFLLAPLEFRRISSRFNLNRFHPILNVARPHIGVDYAAASGTPVMATGDGTVIRRGVNGGYGNTVEIRHTGGFMTRYAHLSGFASGVSANGRVTQGQVIGYVGMTGLATGPHLHYEMHRDGRAIDPLSLDMPQGDPIPPEARDRWTSEFQARYALLDSPSTASSLRIADAGTASGGDATARNE
jgi:murein DD-endopeptidase MepM/ murein hydrolase activator NlpD